MWTIGKLLDWAPGWLGRRGSESPRLDAELLLSSALRCERLDLYLQFDRPCEREELAGFKALVARRGRGEPVAYILGRKGFHAIDLEVGPGVLVPRPETEWLVDKVLAHFDGSTRIGTVVDLGTGSGALALAQAHPWRELEAAPDIVATDVSDTALTCARRNAATLGLADRVRFIKGSDLEPVHDVAPVAAIVSNPPYVLTDVIPTLAPDVRAYEPHLALAGGADGMDVLRRIAAGAHALLSPGGLVAVELGSPEQGAAFAELLSEGGLTEARFEPVGAGPTGIVCGSKGKPIGLTLVT